MDVHENPDLINDFVSRPQHLIEVLEQLQAQTSDTVPGSVYIYDLVDQHTLYASCSVTEMLGYTDDEIHAMGSTGLATLIHPDDLNRVAAHYQRFTTLQYGEVITIQYRMKRADGAWCWLRSQETTLVLAIAGFPLQILGLIQDITQLSRFNSRELDRQSRFFKQLVSTQRIRVSSKKQKQQLLSTVN